MGLKVTPIEVIGQKLREGRITDHSFSPGNEYILYIENKEGQEERVRIPAYLAHSYAYFHSEGMDVLNLQSNPIVFG